MARQPGLAPLLPPEGIRDGVEGFDDIVGGGGLRRVDQPLRDDAYAVDFRGTSMEALRRMDLLDAVQAEATNMGDMYYVDRRDREVATMVPKGNFSIFMRNLMMKLLPLLPVEVMLKETYAAANAISIGAGEGYLI